MFQYVRPNHLESCLSAGDTCRSYPYVIVNRILCLDFCVTIGMKCSHCQDDLQLPSHSSGHLLQVFLKIMTTFSINCFFSQRASLFLLVERVFIFALLKKINTLDKHRDCAEGLFKILPSAIVRSSVCTRRAEQSPFLDLYFELIQES